MNCHFEISDSPFDYTVFDPTNTVTVTPRGGNGDGDSHYEMTGPGWRLFYTTYFLKDLPGLTWGVNIHPIDNFLLGSDDAHSMIEQHLRLLHMKIWKRKGVDEPQIHIKFFN
jgi:hypothetical protein